MRFVEGENLIPKRTSISNMFFMTFLPKANGDYVKLYLYAYFLMKQRICVELNELAAGLQMSVAEVEEGIKYWQSVGLIEVEDNSTVIINDPDSLALANITKTVSEGSAPIENPEARLIRLNKEPEIREMFSNADFIIRRQLAPEEMKRLISWLDEYRVTPDMVLHAISYAYEIKQVKHLDYVEGIIRRWYDAGYTSLEDVLNETEFNPASHIDIVKQCLNLKERDITPPARNMIDSWRYSYGFGDDVIALACAQTINIREPNLAYVDAVLKNWFESGITSLEQAKEFVDKRRSNGSGGSDTKKAASVKKSYRTDEYTDEELSDLLDWKGEL